MRILYITEARLERLDGTTTHIRGLVSGLEAAGAEILLVARSGNKKTEIIVPEITRGFLPTLRSQKALLTFLEELIRRYRPAIVLGRVEYQSLAAPVLSRRFHLPLVADLNGDLAFQMEGRPARQRLLCHFVERRFLEASSRILVTAPAVAELVGHRLNLPHHRFLVLPMGVEESFLDRIPDRAFARRRLGFPPDKPIALYLGTLTPWQGFEALFALSKHLPNWLFLVVGGGPLEKDYRRSAPSDRFRFQGFVRPEELPIFLSAADVLLQPPRHPRHCGMPTKIVEYLAAGTPIVASDRHQTEQDLAKRGFLYCADFSRPESVAAIMLRILENPAIRLETRNRNPHYVRQHLTWRILGTKLLRELSSILESDS
ncbi:MAG: glycosyltransferase [Candidatus Hydrogenedentota bacterium]|nr:MAG: glycosyltransferase [Candidatus Hydrogenedentota bacterium]